MTQTPWWKGTRGEWYVVVQILLMALVFFGPRSLQEIPAWTYPLEELGSVLGVIALVIGGCLFIAGIFTLGPNLTPVPFPKDHAQLIETGPYKLVRHPIYSGGIFVAFGWAFWVHGWLTVIYAIMLFLFLDLKARREEQWLQEKFPGYGAYQQRVHKLIPFVY